MRDVFKKFVDLYNYLELHNVVNGEYKNGELQNYMLSSYHPFVLVRTAINKKYTKVLVINRFTDDTMFSEATTLQEANKLISSVSKYFEQYIYSEVD